LRGGPARPALARKIFIAGDKTRRTENGQTRQQPPVRRAADFGDGDGGTKAGRHKEARRRAKILDRSKTPPRRGDKATSGAGRRRRRLLLLERAVLCYVIMFRNQYDTDVTVWSPEGRLLQVSIFRIECGRSLCAVVRCPVFATFAVTVVCCSSSASFWLIPVSCWVFKILLAPPTQRRSNMRWNR